MTDLQHTGFWGCRWVQMTLLELPPYLFRLPNSAAKMLALPSLFTEDISEYNEPMPKLTWLDNEMPSKMQNAYLVSAVLIHLHATDPFISPLTLSTTGQRCIFFLPSPSTLTFKHNTFYSSSFHLCVPPQ